MFAVGITLERNTEIREFFNAITNERVNHTTVTCISIQRCGILLEILCYTYILTYINAEYISQHDENMLYRPHLVR
jgi:hypothetical protein